jgi:hypothetical protein
MRSAHLLALPICSCWITIQHKERPPARAAHLLALDHNPARGRSPCLSSRRIALRRRQAVDCVHDEQVRCQDHRAGDLSTVKGKSLFIWRSEARRQPQALVGWPFARANQARLFCHISAVD